jgi:hypothetical protein
MEEPMRIIELVQAAKAANKEAFGELPEGRAATMVAAVLAELARSIAESEQPLVLTGFGKFVPRDAKAAGGEALAGPRRFGFRLAEPKTRDGLAARRERRAAERPPTVGASPSAKRATGADAKAAGVAGKGRPAKKAK